MLGGDQMVPQTLGERVRRVYERSGLTLRQAAEQSDGGVTFSYIGKIMSDQVTPTLDALTAVAAVFRTTVEFLREGKVEVDMLAPLIRDPQFRVLGLQAPHQRARGVALLAATLYAGHLRLEDQAEYMGMYAAEYKAQLEGQAPLADTTLERLANLTSVPLGWLRMGHWYWLLPEDAEASWAAVAQALAQTDKK